MDVWTPDGEREKYPMGEWERKKDVPLKKGFRRIEHAHFGDMSWESNPPPGVKPYVWINFNSLWLGSFSNTFIRFSGLPSREEFLAEVRKYHLMSKEDGMVLGEVVTSVERPGDERD
jgi:hypothetical protein